MDSLSMIIGIAATSALLLYFALNMDEKQHGLLKLLFVFFSLGFLIIIPASLLEERQACEVVVNSSTVTGSTTAYTHDYYCYEVNSGSRATFYKGTLWLYRLFMAYVIFYLGYYALEALRNSYSRGKV